MVNRRRGEVEAVLDGTAYRLVLTLGALAELEDAFGDEDMVALASRFDSGRLRARDCVRVIGAGLRGAGYALSDAEVAGMKTDDAAAGFLAIVADLLAATFAAGENAAAQSAARANQAQTPDAAQQRGDEAPGPFPGTR